MKKSISFVMIILLLSSMVTLTSCKSNEEKDLSEIIEEKILAYETDIKDTIDNVSSNKEMSDYLYNWGKSKGIKVSTDSYNNVIMSVKASEELKDNDPTIIQCSFDENNLDSNVTPIAIGLFIAKNIKENGPLKILFTSEKNNNKFGIDNIDKKYFKDNTNVICLGSNNSQVMTTRTGSLSTYSLSHNIKLVDTKESNKKAAYKISINGLNGGTPNSKIGSYPNPIKELGDLLAYLKTNSLIFQLSSIKGGESANFYPIDASMILVVDKDYEEKLTAKLDTAIETFQENNGENQENYSYTYELIKTPKKVYSSKTTDGIISFLYTVIDGVYYKDDNGDVLAISNLGSIRKKKNKLIIDVSANSLEDNLMEEISTSLKTIAGLSNGKYLKTDYIKGWEGSQDSAFITNIELAYRNYSGKTAEYENYLPLQSTSIINEINPKTDMIFIGVTEKTKFKYTGTLYEYLGLPDKEV